MSEQEKAFWEWWEKNEMHNYRLNFRMAFDAGYEAAKKGKQ
jgi:hypothetical protein